MADISIESSASTDQYARALRSGIFWTSPTVGYAIYLSSVNDLEYRKTADGGATWAGAVAIVAAASCDAIQYDCWADWQTAGDAGTKIHIAYMSLDLNQVRYVYLDTSTDTVGGDDLIETCQGTGAFTAASGLSLYWVSITKTRGGNFAVAIEYIDSGVTTFTSFYTSPDADTWTSKTSPLEIRDDYCLLFPGNEADNQDVWGIYWDASTDEISLKTFDNSGNSWSEQLISGSMVEFASYLQMDGVIRLSDGHLILAAWNLYNNVASDLMVWDINGAASITAKTNVITDTAEYFTVSVFINQVNDDIYVAYVGGTDAGTLVKAFYQKSADGGANWDGQATMQADAEEDMRWISCGAAKATWGGKFQPFWFDDDDNDLFTSVDNGISIEAPAAELPTVTTQAATDIGMTTATGNGNITDTGGENCDHRGIVYGKTSKGDPGNTAPDATEYDNHEDEADGFGTGAFTRSLTSLDMGTTYYARAYAHNSEGYSYGAEVEFDTLAPTPVTDGDLIGIAVIRKS